MKKQIKLVMAAFAIMLVGMTSAFAANYQFDISDFNIKDVMLGEYMYEGDSETIIEFYLNKSDKVFWERRYKSSTKREEVMSAWDDIDFWINYSCGLDNSTYYIVQSPGVIKRRNDGAILKFYSRTGSSESGLIYAAKKGNLKLVKAYIEIARISSQSVIDKALAGATNSEVRNYLISKGGTVVDKNAFVKAANTGDLATVKKQVEAKVDINAMDADGWTALQLAAYWGRTDVVKYLISKKANLNIQKKGTKDGKLWGTAVYYAAREGKVDCVRALVEAGADLNICDANGDTAFSVAVNYKKNDVVSYFKGVIKPDNKALRQAAADGNLGGVVNQLTAGAEINSRNADGETALYLTMDKVKYDVAKYLIKKGADVNLGDEDYGFTPLMLAVGSKPENYEMVKLLVENGANVNAKDKWGNTALSDAKEKYYSDIVNYLKEHGAK